MIKVIKAQFIDILRNNDDCKYLLAKANRKKISTIDRWVKENDERLTTMMNLEIMASCCNVSNFFELIEEKSIA